MIYPSWLLVKLFSRHGAFTYYLFCLPTASPWIGHSHHRWGKRGILWDTMKFWRCLRFVWFVQSQIKKDDAFALENFLVTRFQQTKHRWWFWRFAEREVVRVVKYARHEDKAYLGRYSSRGLIKLKVTPRGEDLLDFPLGTLQKFMEQYGRATPIVVGVVIAALPYIDSVVRWLSIHRH